MLRPILHDFESRGAQVRISSLHPSSELWPVENEMNDLVRKSEALNKEEMEIALDAIFNMDEVYLVNMLEDDRDH